MEFFTNINALATKCKKINLTVVEKGGKLTVGFYPDMDKEAVDENLKMVVLTGTPQELDGAFFSSIQPATEKVIGLVSNIEEVEKSIEEAEKEAKKENDRKSKNSKPKPAAKKDKPTKKDEKEEPADEAEPEKPAEQQTNLF